MKVMLQLFAAARDLVGTGTAELELPAGATIVLLREELARKAPALTDLLRHSRFAVNGEYALESMTIPPDAEIACIPPVSGG